MSILTSGALEPEREPRGVLARAKVAARQFASDTAGDVAIIFGLMSIAMFLIIGSAVDLGRWLHARADTMAAVDAAVLAGGRSLQISGDNDAAVAAAERFYNENVTDRLPLNSDDITFTSTDNGTAFTAAGSAYIATPFLRLAGIDELPLLKLSGAEFGKAELAVGGNSELNIEVAMMLDVSGSMDSNNKFEDMQEAATDLVDIVVWADQSQYTSKVAVVPFSGDVRLSDAMLAASRDPAAPASVVGPQYSCRTRNGNTTCSQDTFLKRNCVVERTGTEKYSDAAPGAGKYIQSLYAKTANCMTPVASSVMPLSSDKSALTTKLANMTIGSGTAGHIGTAWAYYMLSPNWGSVVGAASTAAAYGQPTTKKIAILMTDGEYNKTYSIYGIEAGTSRAPTPSGTANDTSPNQAMAICDQMKDDKITVYTVGFDLGDSQTAIDTLEDCATSPAHFYNATDGEQLKQAFRDIALKISSLYLSN
jgi:Flp pilus assembly protein TadG